jgi:hypothetical protein
MYVQVSCYFKGSSAYLLFLLSDQVQNIGNKLAVCQMANKFSWYVVYCKLPAINKLDAVQSTECSAVRE